MMRDPDTRIPKLLSVGFPLVALPGMLVLDLIVPEGSKDNGFAGQEHLKLLLAGYLVLNAMALAQSLPRTGAERSVVPR